MTSKKKVIIVISVVFAVFLIWYLFIKHSDYEINFKANTSTGTIFQGINEWTKQRNKINHEEYVIVARDNFGFLKIEQKANGGFMEYAWKITPINDSVCQVNVAIKDYENSVYNKLTAPFFPTEFKKNQIEKIKDFKKGLEEHLSNIKVQKVSEGSTPEIDVAYISMNSVLQEKAQTMIGNDAIITGFLFNNKIKIIGKPYLEVTKWDLDNETLDFNYCFPVEKTAPKIVDNVVKFKTIPAKKGLKVSCFGNFRTSDRGWFAILDYAKKHNKKLEYKPLEHFLANPFNGGNEQEWETQIIIPYLD